MSTSIGVDIGGSHIVCCGVDLRTNTPVPGTEASRKVNRNGSKEEILARWAEPLNQTLAALGETPIAGIGFAMPGAFNYREGIALFTGNDKYENLYGVNVRTSLPEYLNISNPVMRFINDATAFGISTSFLEQRCAGKRLVAITLGTGFGSAFVDRGKPIMRGAQVPLNGSLWHLPFRDGTADDYFSTRWFINTYRKMTGRQSTGVKEIAERVVTEQDAAGLFTTFGNNLAEFLGPWLSRFQAECLVVGGNIARAWPLMQAGFNEGLKPQIRDLETWPSTLMEEAAMVGGAKLLDSRFWDQIKQDLPQL